MKNYYKINLEEISQLIKELEEKKKVIHKISDSIWKISENSKWKDDIAKKYKRDMKGIKEDLNNIEALIELYRSYLFRMSSSLVKLINQNKI